MSLHGRRPMPPSLTSEELRIIQREERKQRSPAVRRLLWEVFRLQAIALRADQLLRSLGSDPVSLDFNSTDIVADCLREDLAELPVVKEGAERRASLITKPAMQRRSKKD